MKHQHRVASTIGLSLCLTIAAHAQNWPTFRGPNGSGIATTPLPTAWDGEKSSNILWKTPLPGLGHSSPVVWGDRVFVTLAISSADNPNHNPKDADIEPSQDQSRHEWRVVSLDKRSGQILWSRTAHTGVPRVRRHVKATQANATPVTDKLPRTAAAPTSPVARRPWRRSR